MLSWNDFVSWLMLPDVRPFLAVIAVIFAGVVAGGLVASWIASQGLRRSIKQRDREMKARSIGALVDVAIEASAWKTLSPAERLLGERAAGQADIQLRLLPVKGAATAANWSAHRLAELKKSSTAGYETEPALIDFRDRLADWQNKPGKTRKEFAYELEEWRSTGAASLSAGSQHAWIPEPSPITSEPSYTPSPFAQRGPNTEAHQIIKDVEGLGAVSESHDVTPEIPAAPAKESFLASFDNAPSRHSLANAATAEGTPFVSSFTAGERSAREKTEPATDSRSSSFLAPSTTDNRPQEDTVLIDMESFVEPTETPSPFVSPDPFPSGSHSRETPEEKAPEAPLNV